MPTDVTLALEQAYRDERAQLLATLARQVGGDLGLAEDAVQDAFASAATDWPRRGVPDRPGAWLTVTARRRAIDRLRRDQSRTTHQHALAQLEDVVHHDPDPTESGSAEDHAVADDRLRMIFTCCHPSLAIEARLALTLKTLGGLDVPELARAFLTTDVTMYQRITRAKRKILVAGISYRVPDADQLPERLAGVLKVVYLIFNEGHTATSGETLSRAQLSDEAIRIARLLQTLMPADAEVHGLLALLLLTDARRAARTDPDGHAISLEHQDRSLWNSALLAEGFESLDRALQLRSPGPFQIQAAIAALHAEAKTLADTDWHQISLLYDELERFEPSPVITINRAIAVAHHRGPAAGLAILDALADDGRVADYQPFHAARAAILTRTGDIDAAAAAYDRAIALTENASERAALEQLRRHP